MRPLILVIDDDERAARCLALLLEDDGYRAEVATDGAEAIGRLAHAPMPDAIVTDLWIPHADGSLVVRRARELRPAMPVVVVSEHPHLVHELARTVPDLVVLPKPVAYADLLAHLNTSLRSV
jgi:two-component system response regulator MprA